MYLYLIKAKASSPLYKIGVSKDPVKRMERIETSCPFPLSIENQWELEEASKVENFLHLYFGDKQLNGEWFELSLDDLNNIERLVKERAWLFERDIRDKGDVSAMSNSTGSRVVSVRFSNKQYNGLASIAERAGVSISEAVRKIIAGEKLENVYAGDHLKQVLKKLEELDEAISGISERLG